MKDNEKLRSDETEIVCHWTFKDGKMVGDAACDRIDALVDYYLEKVGSDESGWDTLFRDPADGRLWERIYPMSHMHGGGPPALVHITDSDAKKKYANLFE